MRPLFIESTPKTPQIDFNYHKGEFSIKGMSCAEFALDFYRPLFKWLDQYNPTPASQTTFHFHLKYYNTNSAKCILQLLERIAKLKESGHQVKVKWFYTPDDEQMIADGENYGAILDLPIQLVEVQN